MGEGAAVAVVQARGDLRDRHLRVAEELARHFEANLVRERAKRNAIRVEVTVERATVHREAARDVLDRSLALEQQTPHRAPDLAGEAAGRQRFERGGAGRQQCVSRGVGAAQRMSEPALREDQRHAVGVEAQRCAEEVAERARVARAAIWEPDLVRLPLGATEFAQHVARDGAHQLVDVAGPFEAGFVDRVVERAEMALGGDREDGRPIVEAEEAGERPQGRADVRS